MTASQTIADRSARVRVLLAAVKDHPMCADLQDYGTYFRVIYPSGDFPVGGLQSVVREGGRAAALEKLLPVMERHWLQSFPGAANQ